MNTCIAHSTIDVCNNNSIYGFREKIALKILKKIEFLPKLDALRNIKAPVSSITRQILRCHHEKFEY